MPQSETRVWGNMKNDIDNKGFYLAALGEASEELKRIVEEIEQLGLRQTRVEKVIEVLGWKIGGTAAPIQVVRCKTHIPGLTLVTRLAVGSLRCRRQTALWLQSPSSPNKGFHRTEREDPAH